MMMETAGRAKSMVNLRSYYMALVSLAGVALFVWSAILLPGYMPWSTFALLLLLAVAAQLTATVLIGEGVTAEVSTAVSMAVVALFDPMAATFVAAVAATIGIAKSLRPNRHTWKQAAERISFNIGMVTVAMFTAGLLFHEARQFLGADTLLGQTVPWLLAAVVNDQINLWLLIGVLHLQNRARPLEIWRQHRWASPINILVMSVGGGVLALAVRQFDFLGVVVFFLPVVLSAYSFRLYVNQTRQQMEKLEELVALRTNDLMEANKELEALHKNKDAFLAVLTHDMRTALSSVKGYASVLRSGNLSSTQQVQIGNVLMRSQETLLEIVNNILEIEKLQSGTAVSLDYTEFDLAFLASLAAEAIAAQAMEKDITLRYDPDPKPLLVTADREKIKRVLMNLIANAVKYTGEGGSVTITTRLNDGYAVVDVTDTGYGIPADELPYIFERFRRVRSHQQMAIGTGLGLAIVKSLVEAHQGKITVTSEENVGSTFTVILPLQIL
jgi:signal transduction histidine kinase